MTYFLFKRWRMRRSTFIQLTTFFLALSIMTERYCFITVVYKTKYFGQVLIMLVILLNCIFNFFITKLRKTKQQKRLHELFNIDRTPSVGFCIIFIIGILDMLYAFFLFWPSNVIPVWLLITLLQIFIPLNIFLRACCIKLEYHSIHLVAGTIIMAAVIVNCIIFA